MTTRPPLIPSLSRRLLSLIVTILWLSPALLFCCFAPQTSRKIFKNWARWQLKIFGIQLQIEDRNQGDYAAPPYLYVILNQTSLVETFVVLAGLPTAFDPVFNIGFALIPLVGWLFWGLGGIVLVRQWPEQVRRAMAHAVEKLRSGTNFYISIEGLRSPDGALSPYKKGPALLAIESQATIVPLILHGGREVWPLGEWRVRPGKLRLVLGEKISAQGLAYNDRQELVDRLKDISSSSLQSSP